MFDIIVIFVCFDKGVARILIVGYKVDHQWAFYFLKEKQIMQHPFLKIFTLKKKVRAKKISLDNLDI